MTEVALRRLAGVSYGLGQPPPAADHGVPIVRATNIERGRIVEKDLIYTALEDLPIKRTPLLRTGEILVVRSGAYTGDSARVTEPWAGAAPGYDLRVTPGPSVDPRFLAYSLLGSRGLEAMWIASSRAAQPHLNAEELGGVPVDRPTLAQQRAIADFLDTETARIDALITKKRRMIDLLEERFAEQARRAVVLGSTYRDPLQVMGQDAVPRDVRPMRLSWLAEFGSGTTPESGNADYYGGSIPWVLTGDLNDGDLSSTSRTVTSVAMAACSALKLHSAGSLVVAMYGATIGKMSVLRSDATVNQACCVMTPCSSLDTGFLFLYLLGFRSMLIERGRGSGQPNISQEILRSLRLPIPPVQVQAGIASSLAAVRSSTASTANRLRIQIALLQEHRQALITAAVTGELEVPGVAA